METLLAGLLMGKNACVASAGTEAEMGRPADPRMMELACARGMADLSAHRSKPAMPALLARYDLALCMELRHVHVLKAIAPTRTGTLRLLGHWGVGEIADPYRGTAEQYDVALTQIETSVRRWAEKLIQLGMVN